MVLCPDEQSSHGAAAELGVGYNELAVPEMDSKTSGLDLLVLAGFQDGVSDLSYVLGVEHVPNSNTEARRTQPFSCGMSITAPISQLVKLRIQAYDGNTGLFPQIKVYDPSGALATNLALTHIAGGLYEASWTPAVEGILSAVGQVLHHS